MHNYAKTNSGTTVPAISKEKQLRRMTVAHMLWEDQAYIDGISAQDALASLVKMCDPKLVEATALEARERFKLRHVPLALMRELARNGKLKAESLASVIQRPDEIGEFISLYWKDKRQPLSNQVKKGIALAFNKFNEYQFAKWDKNSAAVRLRDALFLVHAKPDSKERADLFKKIADDKLEVPDTWETQLSAGADKRETFTRLMHEKKLGALAFLRNLRNMTQAGVSENLIREYANHVSVDRVLPFRFLAAQKHVDPKFHDMLGSMMVKSLQSHEKLKGRTVLVVDVSGSMRAAISSKSDMDRLGAAAALAVLAREICEDVVIYATAGNDGHRKHATKMVPKNLRGMELARYFTSHEANRDIGGGGIFFTQVMDYLSAMEGTNEIDRVIVFTDEQDTSMGGRAYNPATAKRLAPEGKNYIVNVGSNQNGINSKEWLTITGMSEAVIDFIQEVERSGW